jgi:hypothetical protein
MIGEPFGWNDDVTTEGQHLPDIASLTSEPGIIVVGHHGPLIEIKRFHPAIFTG